MKIKILSLITIIFIFCAMLVPSVSFADKASRSNVENLLAGNQDLLVFANIVSKDQYSYEVQVTELISPVAEEDENGEDAPKFEGQKISVDHFGGYMYFADNVGIVPQLGDNVLLSLETAGNRFYVKNGAYKVDYASSELFSFIAPDIHTGASEIAELKALYLYISTKAKTNGIVIEDNEVYADGNDGEKVKQDISGGISLIDGEGELADNPAVGKPYDEQDALKHESKWQYGMMIIILGMIIGASLIIFANKFEKRYDEN